MKKLMAVGLGVGLLASNAFATGTSVVDFTTANETVTATGTAAISVGLGAFAIVVALRYGKKLFRAIVG